MNYTTTKLKPKDLPRNLQNIPSPPNNLYVKGDGFEELLKRPKIAVVGSRKYSPYGRQITELFSYELASQGVIIISGLALGIDSIAHKTALENKGSTIAVLPCGLDIIYPGNHKQLSEDILKTGGALVSEYSHGTPALRHNFIARNRIISGLADALLITEAANRSGTLHTANFALEQGKPVLSAPGNITSANSEGTNTLIKSGAIPVTSTLDILEAIGLNPKTEINNKTVIKTHSEEERVIIDLLKQGITDGHQLLVDSKLSTQIFNQTLTMLEINGFIKPLGNNHWTLR